jgi:hypothetical protein
MPPLERLGADALASELAKIPSFTAAADSTLNAVRIALAQAIASGQSADQLATDLGLPSAWRGVDLSRPPSVSLANRQPAVPPPPAASASASPPDWAAKIIPIALAKKTTARIVVLDREPTALGGLEMPAWARALKPSATYGPITVSSPTLQATTQKWIIIFWFTGTVELVRDGIVLCVVPISIFELGPPPTQARITSGSAWIAVNPFDAAAPAGSFAGIAVQSGQIASDHPLVVSSGVINLPLAASLTLNVVPSPLPAGPPGFPATVTAPASISVSFPASGSPSITFSSCAATLYQEPISCAPSNLPAAFNQAMNLLYIPGQTSASAFTPQPVSGRVVDLGGSAPIETAGWALSVSQTNNPATLGTAFGPGDFAIAFGAGLTCQWTGLPRPEPEVAGFLIAQNTALVLYLISVSPKGVFLKQEFELWVDQDSPSQSRCELLTARQGGQPLIYALAGSEEILEFGAVFDALIDRPVLASGARVRTIFIEGILALIRNNSGNRLYAYSAAPPPTIANQAFPMALDNALLGVSEPLAIFIYARTDANFNSTSGDLLLLFGYVLVELYLPDPYTGDLALDGAQGRPTTFGSSSSGSVAAGYLIATVIWTAPDKPKLRLLDLAHTHPVIPPSTEASSTCVPPTGFHHILPFPFHELAETTDAPTALEPPPANTEIQQHAPAPPPPDPVPPTPPGVVLLDLSTRASQLGVEVITGERQNLLYTIDGLSVRGPAALLPLTTLPAIAWEPMYDLSTATDPGVDDFELLHPPGDGPFTQIRSTSAALVPISPLQSLQAVLDSGTGGFTAHLTLPFGMIGALDAKTQNGTILPDISLVQPTFTATLTPTGVPYTGAWQLSVAAPDPNQSDPVLAGRTYLRTPTDAPPRPNLSYGEMVLGTDVAAIFSSEFDPPLGSKIGTGVPLRRYDLTGYGASTFSEWTATNAPTTAVIKAFFHVLVGRTSHEVIQVQSLIYPWAIKVVRTITIDRQASGVVQRYDSGWQAASDGLFDFPGTTGITKDQIHAGVTTGVIKVKNIQQLGLPIFTQGTQDGTGYGGVTPITMTIEVQPVTFDSDVIINPQHHVLQGGIKEADLKGAMHTCVPSKGVTGFIGLQFDYHLSMTDMVGFTALQSGAGGPINATLNLGASNHLLRATEFDATPIQDFATSGLGLACAVRGVPKLSSDGAWGVAKRRQNQAAPVSLSPQQAAPVLQPNTSGGTAPGTLIHYADPADLFRLDPASTTPPATLYGFMQTTGTQSNLLSRPTLTVGSTNLTLADALNVAHAGALLGAISSFPAIGNCLQFLSSELQPIANQLTAPSLSTTQNLYLKDPVRKTPISLISTSIADVNLYFYQKGDDLTKQANPPNVVVTLGSPTPPSWSLDVNHLAIGLVIPALGSTPVIWFQGGFHADADTGAAFPNLQTEFDSPLDVLATLFTVLNDFASILSPGGSSSPEVIKAHDAPSNPGLQTSFSDGKLTVSDSFTLPSIPLGLGDIQNVSLNIGTTLDILALNINFLVGIGTPTAPVHWIVDPLSGTLCVQAGIQNNSIAVLIQAGIGLGLAIDLGIASGSASIVIAVQLQINGSVVTILLLLTGQAQVSVLGGLASAAITLTAGLGFSINVADLDIDLIGTASVGIHISICWVININFSGSWTFQKQLPFNPL